jgi:hypothetical protein
VERTGKKLALFPSRSPLAFGIYGLRSGAMTGQQVRVTIIASLLSGLVGVLVSFFFFRR